MPTIIERNDYDFLLLASKFCTKIDNYLTTLNLNKGEVEELKNDNMLFEYVFTNSDNYKSCAESFTRYKIQNMRIKLSHLIQNCKNSNHYTMQIGADLGIEIPIHAFLPN